MSTIFRTFLNYREEGPQSEVSTLPSETQPNEVMSIRDMLLRHVRGLPVPHASEHGRYYGESLGYVPSRDELDLTEISDYADHYRDLVAKIKSDLEAPVPPKASESGEADKPPSEGEPLDDSDGAS